FVERDMPLEADAAVGRVHGAALRHLLAGAIERERRREEDALVRRAQGGIDQCEEVAPERALEAERMLERHGPRLPIEELVHAEERRMVERQALLVDARREQRVLAGGTDRQDERDRAPLAPRRGEVVEELVGEASMQLLPRLRERERQPGACRQLVRGNGE